MITTAAITKPRNPLRRVAGLRLEAGRTCMASRGLDRVSRSVVEAIGSIAFLPFSACKVLRAATRLAGSAIRAHRDYPAEILNP
jgi:hypothetical protein